MDILCKNMEFLVLSMFFAVFSHLNLKNTPDLEPL